MTDAMEDFPMSMIDRTSLALAAVLGALALSPAAWAHAKLVGADPAAGGEAKAGLVKLRLAFSEAVAAKLSGAALTDAAGQPVATAPAMIDPADPKALVMATKAPLKAGRYTVVWRAVASDDGHLTKGVYSFMVH
jgi:methionine-rich copper-binding protein CopC